MIKKIIEENYLVLRKTSEHLLKIFAGLHNIRRKEFQDKKAQENFNNKLIYIKRNLDCMKIISDNLRRIDSSMGFSTEEWENLEKIIRGVNE